MVWGIYRPQKSPFDTNPSFSNSVVTIARSTNPGRMLDNLEYDDMKLGRGDVRTIDSLYTGQDL